MQQKRDGYIDEIKGIGIIIMVLGHCGFPYFHFLFLFHMPVFFMVSGYLFHSSRNSSDLKSVIAFTIRKLKSLWFPNFLWQSIFILFHNFFIKTNIYTDQPEFLSLSPGQQNVLHEFMTTEEILKEIVKSFFFLGETQLGGAFWFLRVLFAVTVMYCVMEFILGKVFHDEKKVFWGQIIISAEKGAFQRL